MIGASVFRDFFAWGPDATGSTRAVGLMRIGLAALAMIRFGSELAPFAAAAPGLLLISLAFFALAVSAFVGRSARMSIGLLGVTILTFYGLTAAGRGVAGWNHHHVYILGVACILLSLTDCGRSYSYDRWRALQQDNPEPEHGKLLGQRLIVLQLSALYFWTAVDKTDAAFLSGERLEQIFVWSFSGRLLEVLLISPALLAALSITVVIVEYFLAFAILTKRWLHVAMLIGLCMHATFYLLLPVNIYSATMILLYLALLDPNAVRNFTDRMQSS